MAAPATYGAVPAQPVTQVVRVDVGAPGFCECGPIIDCLIYKWLPAVKYERLYPGVWLPARFYALVTFSLLELLIIPLLG